MGFFNKKHINPIFAEIDKEYSSYYQVYFYRIINSVDILNETSRIDHRMSQKFSLDKCKKDKLQLLNLLVEAQDLFNLNPILIYILYKQYIYADAWLREKHSRNWVEYILSSQETMICPPAYSVLSELFPKFIFEKIKPKLIPTIITWLSLNKNLTSILVNEEKVDIELPSNFCR
jgi:hypothetical protein